MSSIDVPLHKGGFGRTARKDTWWIEPLLVFLGFSAFIVYSTWAALQGDHYTFGPYLSPFYSPLLMTEKPGWWPAFLPFSAAMLILWAPGRFRLTCYYYRGAYYKAFWADPPSCAVGEPRKTYLGRTVLPADPAKRPSLFSVSGAGVHRAPVALTRGRRCGSRRGRRDSFGIGVGTLVMIVNPILLGALHARMPFAAASGRRAPGCDVEGAGAQDGLRLRHVPESPPHDVGVVQPVLGRIHRHLYPALLDGRSSRLEDSC